MDVVQRSATFVRFSQRLRPDSRRAIAGRRPRMDMIDCDSEKVGVVIPPKAEGSVPRQISLAMHDDGVAVAVAVAPWALLARAAPHWFQIVWASSWPQG